VQRSCSCMKERTVSSVEKTTLSLAHEYARAEEWQCESGFW
jgi:hypothetical protein